MICYPPSLSKVGGDISPQPPRVRSPCLEDILANVVGDLQKQVCWIVEHSLVQTLQDSGGNNMYPFFQWEGLKTVSNKSVKQATLKIVAVGVII